MLYKKIDLTENAYLEAYIADPVTDFTRKAILVIGHRYTLQLCKDRLCS